VDEVEDYRSGNKETGPNVRIFFKEKTMAIVTISREFGSPGKEIGQQLAKRLDYAYIDRAQILERMRVLGKEWAKRGEEFDEHPPSMWERNDWSYQGFVALSQSIILNFGRKDRVVLMGRGGNFLFKGIPYALRVRITMPKEARIERVMKEDKLPRKTACWFVKKIDKEMTRAVYAIYGEDWDDPTAYDMLFDLAKKTETEIIQKIVTAAKERDQFNTVEARTILRLRAIAAKVKSAIATNPRFLVPTFDTEATAEGIALCGIIHNPTEQRDIEKIAKRLAEDVSIQSELHYRGLVR